tara:strand:+ start:214 stop:528 length:315 start_codon:yes stop_codon:yes gene_type:complete
MNLLLGIIKDIANIFSNKTRKFIAAFFLIIGLSMIVFAMKLSSDSDIFSGALGGILFLIGLMFSFLALVFLPPLDLEPFLMAQLDEQLESERESLEEEMKSDPS